jgi:hypothetical protein
MSRIAAACPASPNPRRKRVPAWHAAFLKMLPAIREHARVCFRDHKPEARQELVQEVICNAVKAYARLVQLGKAEIAYAGPLAKYAVAQVRDHRRVGNHLNIGDVLSSYCQSRKNLTVERLDKFDSVAGEWQEIVVEDKHAGPADIARVRLDFAAFLRSLPARVRRIAKFLARGETTSAAAEKFKVSAGRISQVRKELLLAWHRFVGDDPEPAVA